MGFFSAMEQRAKAALAKAAADAASANQAKLYNDIGCLLWYDILYFDVLKPLQHKMDEQILPFLCGVMGERYLMFGPVKALTSNEKIEEFQKKAEAELLDRGYGKCKVRVTNTNIIVRFI